jgi:alkylation response protein AidB-like acyl-CoA dehydrogenase
VLGPVDPVEIGALNDNFLAALAPRYCNMRKTTIYAGSNEIQRNIIARHGLGL